MHEEYERLKAKNLLKTVMFIPIFFAAIPLSMLINAILENIILYVGNISWETAAAVAGVVPWYFFVILTSLFLTIIVWVCVNSKLLIAKILGFSIFFVGLVLGLLILVLSAGVGTP